MEERLIIYNLEEDKKEDEEYYNNLISYLTKIYLEEVEDNE